MDRLKRVRYLPQPDVEAELLRGLRLQVVRLVDDEMIERGDGAAPTREVGQQQGVVHNHQVRALGRLARPLEEAPALPHEGVLARKAVSVGGGEARPGRACAGVEAQLRAVSAVCLRQPARQRSR